ncbi:MAG: HAMP domain-containing sensor histidine kinase [Patescibacteria group bacterium]|nr:HAMP domain-containing sensor histidine kinase [Patescibacteria group bacterium]
MFWKFLDDLNFISRCKKYNLGLWQCPNFLFLVMTIITVIAMLATNYIAQRYNDEAVTIFSVSGVTVLIMTVGSFVIRGVEKIAEANIIKSEFISIISHQLCTPLSAVKWNLEILETEGSESLSEKQKTFLENVKKSNEKMLKLVSDLLEVVRIDQERTVFNMENVELEPLAREVIGELEHLVESKNVKIIERYDPNLSKTRVDAKKIKIVMENIIANAIKYSYDGGKVIVSLGMKGKKILLIVQDSGVGIPRYQHGKVFEKFFRSANESRYRTDGVGLGLYLVKAILNHFGGEVRFESEAGEGSTFYVSLPAVK